MKRVLPSRPPVLSLAAMLTAFLLASCATSRDPATVQYRPAQNETMYRASEIDLGTMFPSGGLSQDPRVGLRSWATCSGENCQPQQAWFAFVVRRASPRVLSERDVRIKTDEAVHSWPAESRQSPSEWGRTNPGGELVRISMELSTLHDIAQSQTLSGAIGNEEFSLSYEERAPLRALVEEIGAASQQNAPS